MTVLTFYLAIITGAFCSGLTFMALCWIEEQRGWFADVIKHKFVTSLLAGFAVASLLFY